MTQKIEYGEDIYNLESLYQMNLSDPNAVKLLIQHRDRLDSYYKIEQNNYFDSVGDVKPINEDVILAYVDLDNLIKMCNFDKTQRKIIQMVQEGYTYREIGEELGVKNSDTARNRFNKICRDIAKMNDFIWRKHTYINKLGLITKPCSKCKEFLPATDEFFRSRSDNFGDGFYNSCRKCEN